MRILALGMIMTMLGVGCDKRSDGIRAGSLYRAQRESIYKTITFPGKVSSSNKVVITAPLGNKIKSLRVALGQRVAKGTVLLEYDESSVLAEINKLKNDLASRRAEIRNNQLRLQGLNQKFESARLLFSKKLGAARDVEEAKRELASAQNTMEVKKMEAETSQATLERAKANLKSLQVVAPISGTITGLWLGSDTFVPGSNVKEGEKLVTISDMDSLIINGRLSETESFNVTKNSRVEIRLDALAGKRFEGRILSIDPTPEVDQNSGIATIPIKIALLGSGGTIRVGMNAQCDIILQGKNNALVVPLSAVKNDGTSDYVEVYRDGALAKRQVQLGVTNDIAAEIAQGLGDGELVKVP